MVQKYDITLSGGLKSAKPKKDQRRRESHTWIYLGLVGQIGYTVAVPLVAGALGGVFIDKALGTRPIFTLIGLGIGGVVSVVGFARTIRDVLKKKL